MNLARVGALAALVIVPAAALAAAGPVEGLIDSVLACADKADGAARLACYDGLIPSFRVAKTSAVTPSTPATPPVAEAPPADGKPWYDPLGVFGTNPRKQVRPEQFGSERLEPPPPAPGQPAAPAEPPALDSITATVAEYSFTPFGKFIVILENGQIWQQLQNDGGLARFTKSGKNTVVISRGLLGSYNMLINDSVARFKVKRLK